MVCGVLVSGGGDDTDAAPTRAVETRYHLSHLQNPTDDVIFLANF
jgi:hypothetical protein